MLSLYLIRHGYHVRTADNGQAALEVLSKENVDLVLLDLMLPRVDGFAELRRVRENLDDRKRYIVVVSTGASEKDPNQVLELGAHEYMPKPFHLIHLLERIQRSSSKLRSSHSRRYALTKCFYIASEDNAKQGTDWKVKSHSS